MINRRSLILATIGGLTATIVHASIPPRVDLSEVKPKFIPIPKDRTVIIPDINRADDYREYIEDNTRTLIYRIMTKWNFTQNTMEWATTDSQRYKDWLKDETEWKNGIPPHIQFGGAVKAGAGDSTFHQRWIERTLKHLEKGTFG